MLVGVETHPNSMASPHAAYTGWDPRQATGSRLLGPHLPTPAQGGFRPYVRFRIGGDGTPSSHTYSAFPTPSRSVHSTSRRQRPISIIYTIATSAAILANLA